MQIELTKTEAKALLHIINRSAWTKGMELKTMFPSRAMRKAALSGHTKLAAQLFPTKNFAAMVDKAKLKP